MLKTLISAAFIALIATACTESGSLRVSGPSDANGNFQTADVRLPLSGKGLTEFPPPPFPLTPEINQIDNGTCILPHLGRTKFYADQVINFMNGTATSSDVRFIAPNRDILTATSAGTFVPSGPGVTIHGLMEFSGGTGRFADASGEAYRRPGGFRHEYDKVRSRRRLAESQVRQSHVIRIIAVLSSGLMAGLLFGDWLGPAFARSKMTVGDFIEFQQIVHLNYLRVLPVLSTVSIAAPIMWLISLRRKAGGNEFKLVVVALIALAIGYVITIVVNVPINTQLESWVATSPPADARAIWSQWEKAHAARTVFWVAGFLAEIIALTINESMAGSNIDSDVI